MGKAGAGIGGVFGAIVGLIIGIAMPDGSEALGAMAQLSKSGASNAPATVQGLVIIVFVAAICAFLGAAAGSILDR